MSTETPAYRGPRMLESRLEAIFREKVRLRLGGMVVKLAPTVKGIPDRLVLLPGGRMYLVELKTDTGQLSAMQEAWHEAAESLGTDVDVVRGLEGIDRWIKKHANDAYRADNPPAPRGRPRSRDLSASLTD